MSEAKTLVKLNVGCGGQVLPGYINLDNQPYPHVHILHNLESPNKMRWRGFTQPLTPGVPENSWGFGVPDDYFDRILVSHTFEHVTNILPMMSELYRVAKPGCSMVIITPYGSSDNADEDPTHVRRVFKDTYHYFSQALYGKNSYGYMADWEYKRRIFIINKEYKALDDARLGAAVSTLRNVVKEFHAELVAVKPARNPGFQAEEPSTAIRYA